MALPLEKDNNPRSGSGPELAPRPSALRLMIVDEDENLSRFLGAHLGRRNFDVNIARTGEACLRVFRNFDPDVVLLDMDLQGMPAVETLERIRAIKTHVTVIMMAGENDPSAIFQASKAGADDILSKPIEPRDVEARVFKLMDRRKPTDAAPVHERVRRNTDFAALFGTSPKMEDVKLTIDKVAETNATVLIRGESGTGKEVVARLIYGHSARADKPFVKVNCAAIPNELLESELFGYEQGAFTGANRQKPGKFDQANTGTIFLDEISEMHPSLQAKLLHVLQDGEFARLGGKRDIAVDVRVLAATNKPLEVSVAQGTFREDLFYRLNVVSIHIPPLRERREEIPVFLDFFLNKYSEYYGKNPAPFSDYAVQRMTEYDWPGNIRELENLVKRYTIVGNEPQIIRELSTHKPIMSSVNARPDSPLASVPPAVVKPTAPANGKSESLDDMPSLLEIGRRAAMKAEREAIERVLVQTKWNRRQAAKVLKVSYKALLNKLKLMEEEDAQAKSSSAASGNPTA